MAVETKSKTIPDILLKYVGKGNTGIENLGNTCFLNVCMQALSHTYELSEFLDSDKCSQTLKEGTDDALILNEWNDLRRVMWSGNGVVNPGKFVHNIQSISQRKNRDLFTGFAQNDMPEFLLFIIDCMHTSVSRKITMNIRGNAENNVDELAVQCYSVLKSIYEKDYSEIMDMFYGMYVSVIISKDGQRRLGTKPETYFILDMPILEETFVAKNIYECFDLFIKPEVLEGDNAWFNEKTGAKEDIKKLLSFWSFPKILVITFKRFTPDGQRKINNFIDFPIEGLDLSKYVCGYNASSFQYDLYCVCNHFGGVMGGHYTAFVKNAENRWVHYNDNSIEIVNEDRKSVV